MAETKVKVSSDITLARVDDGADGKMLYATSSTDATTAAKVATLSEGTFELATGATVSIKFDYGNTAANPTLDLGGTGAIPIYTQGVPYAYWQAGATIVVVYDGTCWRVASEPVYADTATIGNAAGNNVYIDCDSVDIKNGDTVLATFTENQLVLGKASDDAKIDMCNGNIEFSTKTHAETNRSAGQITAKNSIGIYSKGTDEGDGDGLIDIEASRMLDLRGKQVEVISTDSTYVASNKDVDMYGENININYDTALKLNQSTVADFITETGTSVRTEGSWTYRKYNSGVMEAWGCFTKTTSSSSAGLENIKIAVPSSMTAITSVNVSSGATGSTSSGVCYVKTDNRNIDTWVNRATGSNKEVWAYMHVFGTWK